MSDGRTVWWPKDAAWWRREWVVALGEEFGPAGPAVVDWLTCEAKAQNDGGRVKAGVRSCARGAFVDPETVGHVLSRAVTLGALDDFTAADGRFTARISGWEQDNERGRAAVRKARQRAREADPEAASRPVTPGHGESPTGQDRRGATADAVDGDVVRLCQLQSQLARARTNQPAASARLRPTRRWHAEMERLLHVDGRTAEQIEQVIRWVDGHHFWAPNVLTVETLRKHFDRFAAAVAAEHKPGQPAAPARDGGGARRARAAVAFAELLRPEAEEIEGSVACDAP